MEKLYVNLIEFLVWVGFCGYWPLDLYKYIYLSACDTYY